MDPIDFGYLARIYLGGNNNNRVTYINDTIPRIMTSNTQYSAQVTIRNEGWNTLNASSTQLLVYFDGYYEQLIPTDILPGAVVNINIQIIAGNPGNYSLTYELSKNGGPSFSQYGNLPWKSMIEVK